MLCVFPKESMERQMEPRGGAIDLFSHDCFHFSETYQTSDVSGKCFSPKKRLSRDLVSNLVSPTTIRGKTKQKKRRYVTWAGLKVGECVAGTWPGSPCFGSGPLVKFGLFRSGVRSPEFPESGRMGTQ